MISKIFNMLTENTKILMVSEDGLTQTYVNIQDIRPGDTVVSAKTGEPVTVVHCGYTEKIGMRMTTIQKNSFGVNCPFEKITVSDNARIMLNIMRTPHQVTFPLLMFPTQGVSMHHQMIRLYAIDLQDNTEGVVVSGLPLQILDTNGLWERMGMISN